MSALRLKTSARIASIAGEGQRTQAAPFGNAQRSVFFPSHKLAAYVTVL